MFSSAEKTNKNVTVAAKQADGQSFFRKAGEDAFFGAQEQGGFFTGIQPKLTVSQPDDPLEKEADAVAEKVMRMPESSPTISTKEEEKLQRQEEEEEEMVQAKQYAPAIDSIQCQEEEEEMVQAKQYAPAIDTIQCKEEEEEMLQPKLAGNEINIIHRQEAEEEEALQAKLFSSIQRACNGNCHVANSNTDDALTNGTIQTKHNSLYHSDVIQRSGRGPPVSSMQFQSNLQSSKGGGSVLPESTRTSMEQRFQADFSGVKIHTGSSAENLTSQIHAQAFAYGNDIYFNSGKYSPNTASGGTLLAHELTHTIQQGATKNQSSNSSLASRKIIQRSAADTDVVAGIDVSAKTGGSALSGEAKDYLQDYFHTDLRDIRIHTDNEASEVCKSIGASAYTRHKNILIKPSQYQPNTEQGAILLSEQITQSLRQRGIHTTGTDGNAVSGMGLISQITAAIKELAQPPAPTQNQNIPEATTAESAADKAKGDAKIEKKGSKPSKKDGKKGKQKGKGEKTDKAGKKALKKSPKTPQEDPAFQNVVKKTDTTAKDQKDHVPAEEKSADAQKAAEAVPNEAESKAQNKKTEGMGKATEEDKPFDAVGFKAELLKKIEEVTPKNLKEATEFKDNNKIENVKGAMGEKVASEKENTTGPVNKATTDPLQVNDADNKQPVTLPPTDKGPQPAGVGAKNAAPKPMFDNEISMDEQSQSLDEEMKANDVSEDQLANSGEPTFTAALDEKKSAQQDAKEKPLEYRKDESLALQEAKGEAQQDAGKELNAMNGSRGKNFDTVVKTQQTAKQKDEERRAQVAKDIEEKYTAAETKVNTALNQADTEANRIFDEGSEAASAEFENYVDTRMRAYKADRYSGFWGGLRWAKDKLFGMPDEVNVFYTDGRQLYLNKMDTVITQVADVVTAKLNEAKQAIKDGKKEIDEYVAQLPKDLQDVGKEAQSDIQDKFDALEQSVNDKKDQLIDGLAKKYVDNVKKLDDRISELKEANQGLIDKAIGFLKKVWKVIKDLYNLFTTILARLAAIIGVILDNPSGFFENVGKAFDLGFNNFKNKFTEYLELGLMEWLATNLGIKGIEMPAKFDASAIFSLALQVMGITKDHIRDRAVVLLGPEKVELLETAGGILQRVYTEGVGAIWDMIMEKLTDFKDIVWEAIKSFIQKSIIEAAIVFILSLLNPIGAFVKVCMAIYDFLMMLVRFKDRIIELLDTILSAVVNIASGAVDSAAKAIENALAKSISVIIGFLAALLHLNNVATKVKEIIMRIQKRVEKGIDWVIMKAYSLIGKGVEGALMIKNKGKEMVEKGKDKVVEVGTKAVGAVASWLGLRVNFKTDNGEEHSLYMEMSAGRPVLIMKSDPTPILQFLTYWDGRPGLTKKQKNAIAEARSHYAGSIEPLLLQIKQGEDVGKPEAELKPIVQQLARQNMSLSEIIKRVLGSSVNLAGVQQRYALEGLTGQYSSMPEATGDDLEADHQPQNSLLVYSARQPYFMEPGLFNMKKRAENRSALGRAINLHMNRHKAGRTHGQAPGSAANLASVRGAIDAVTLSTDISANKRRRVVNILKAELSADVTRLKQVANRPFGGSSPNIVWADINSLGLSDADRDTLGNQIRNAIISGETQMAGQPMDNLIS